MQHENVTKTPGKVLQTCGKALGMQYLVISYPSEASGMESYVFGIGWCWGSQCTVLHPQHWAAILKATVPQVSIGLDWMLSLARVNRES